jgi:serine protease AprX
MLISVMLAVSVAASVAASVASNTVVSSTGADPALANRHAMWISLTDKALPKGGVRAEHTPLTARALARRAAHDSVRGTDAGLKSAPTTPLVDARDLPIASTRLDAVLATGAKFRAKSRWLNAISVDATDAQMRSIARLPFVATMWQLHASSPLAESLGTPVGGGMHDGMDGGIAGGGYGYMDAQLMQIDVPSMHARGFHGEGMVIGILDTGFNRVHEAFHSVEHPLNVLAEWDFINNDANTGIEVGDPDGQHMHGTWILGTMAAYVPGTAVASAYAARFVLAKTEVLPTETPIEEDYYVAGLEFIEAQGADLATSSLGYIDWYTPEMLDGVTAVTTRAVNIATSHGLVCLTAAGNEGHDANPATHTIIAPADAFDVITCGAADSAGVIAGFSSDGPTADGRLKPEVLARGVAVASVHATAATGYQAVSGTSLSTPLIAGATALILQARPDFGVSTLRSALFNTASDFVLTGTTDPLFVRGYGVISALDAAKTNRAAEDINLDGAINAQDLAILLSSWGLCADPDLGTGFCIADFNFDANIDAQDLARLLSSWGG